MTKPNPDQEQVSRFRSLFLALPAEQQDELIALMQEMTKENDDDNSER